MLQRDADAVIVFIHIERTAGSSIHAWFHPHNRPEFVDKYLLVSGDGELPAVAERLKNQPGFYLGGHANSEAIRPLIPK